MQIRDLRYNHRITYGTTTALAPLKHASMPFKTGADCAFRGPPSVNHLLTRRSYNQTCVVKQPAKRPHTDLFSAGFPQISLQLATQI